jgi:hypothetical protein
MSILYSVVPALIPLAQTYLLWRIYKELQIVSQDSTKRDELKKQIKDFGLMFAAAADVPRPARSKKAELDTIV